MSNYLAIATVTATLHRILSATVPDDVSSATITAVRPTPTGTGFPVGAGANIYLYQATPNAAWRNNDVPTRDARGGVVQRPRIALDLHYLLTFHGADLTLEPQRVMGSVVRTLHARPTLTRESIRETVLDPLYSFLAATADTPGSDLADEIERVRFTPVPLSLEELSKLWSILLQTSHLLGMVYVATVVLLEAEESPRRALPVRERDIRVFPFQRAVIDRVISEDGPTAPIEMGGTILIEGSQLAGAIDRVRVGEADLQPVAGSVTPSRLAVALTDPALRAGVQGVQVVYANGSASNVAALVLRPVIAVDQPGVTDAEIPIDFDPAVGRAQPVELYLNQMIASPGAEPRAYSFKAPADNGIASPAVDATTQIVFEISGVEPDVYLVRVRVSGAENVLEADGSPDLGYYTGPTVDVPEVTSP